MADEHREKIEQLIRERGPQGVNAISRETGLPLSTMQKYLERQHFFVKNEHRKWDIPANAVQAELAKAQGNFDSVIDSQLTGIDSMFELLSSSIRSTITLMKSQKIIAPARVAGVDSTIHPKIVELDKSAKKLKETIGKNLNNVPEEYKELFKNLDVYQLIIQEGMKYINSTATMEIASVILGEFPLLSEETLSTLKEYQYK